MLTDTKIRKAKHKDKEYTLSDGRGLHLQIHPNGSKYWHFRYTINGKRKLTSLGVYPAVSLAGAREKRDEYKKQIAQEIDPVATKKQKRIEEQNTYTFEKLLREWCEYYHQDLSEGTKQRTLRNLELYIIPWLGNTNIKELTSPELLQCLRRVESQQKLETANRLKGSCSLALRYGVQQGYCERDITQDLKGALKTATPKHMSTLTDPKEISQLLQDMDRYKGSFIVKCALKLSPLVFVRPKELSNMKWVDIDFKKKEWIVPADDMKMKVEHIVPLCKQSIEILEDIRPLTGTGKYVFQGIRNPNKPMSSASVNSALKRMGYKNKIVSHGFRSMASTILNEHGFRYDVIEKQLAHQERNAVRGAYNHAQYLDERRDLMIWWGDYLEKLKNQSNYEPIDIAQ